MGKFWDRVLGVPDDEDFDDDDDEIQGEDEKKPRQRGRVEAEPAAKESESAGFFSSSFSGGKKQTPVVNVYSQKQYKVVIVKPYNFSESKSIAEHLKARRAVILNLEKSDEEVAQRIVDFISGTTFALGGKMQKVGEVIFMFVPSNVDVNEEVSLHTEREMPWMMK
ncbi:MAG: cell division protein SepF [Gracilibacteraceae bacterium]|jgi:cell division inhibitor SepF|nr:cell division protein SepF [Gracilibacteraceae bacterium]